MPDSPSVHLCEAHSSQLVVIDIQERLAQAMPDAAREQVVRNSTILLKAATLLNIPVAHTEQYPRGLGATLESIAQALPDDNWSGEKTGFSCCAANGFLARLQDAGNQVVLAGMETHVCVLQTAMELHARGFQVYVAEDATCSRFKQHHRNALQRLRQTGVVISNTESVLFEWLRDASHPQFKSIAALIR